MKGKKLKGIDLDKHHSDNLDEPNIMRNKSSKLTTKMSETSVVNPYPSIVTISSAQDTHLTNRQVVDLMALMGTANTDHNNMILLERSLGSCPANSIVHVLFKVMQAICEQQIGMKEKAEESMSEAREGMTKFFDRFEFLVAGCYALMSYYEAACGRHKTAKFYFQSVDFFIREFGEKDRLFQLHKHKLSSYIALAPEW